MSGILQNNSGTRLTESDSSNESTIIPFLLLFLCFFLAHFSFPFLLFFLLLFFCFSYLSFSFFLSFSNFFLTLSLIFSFSFSFYILFSLLLSFHVLSILSLLYSLICVYTCFLFTLTLLRKTVIDSPLVLNTRQRRGQGIETSINTQMCVISGELMKSKGRGSQK